MDEINKIIEENLETEKNQTEKTEKTKEQKKSKREGLGWLSRCWWLTPGRERCGIAPFPVLGHFRKHLP